MVGIRKQQNGFAVKTIFGALTLAAFLAGGASVAQAADSNDRVLPPSPADVAMLRSLLALQHPTLRPDSTASATVTTTPAVATEPTRTGQTS